MYEKDNLIKLGGIDMKEFKRFMVSALVLALIGGSSLASVKTSAAEIKFVVPDFTVMIGSKLFSLEYVNNVNNKAVIDHAIAVNTGEIYTHTSSNIWITGDSQSGTEISELSGILVDGYNGKDMKLIGIDVER